MAKNKKYVHGSYFPHQYEKEEEFLSKMAREGWHFVRLHYGFPVTRYEFDKGEPIDYVYQLDYVTKKEDTEDYHALFADAGWEEIFSWNGVYDCQWYYFRRVRTGEKDDRIFTDTESKYQMYDKLWKKYGLFFIVIFSLQINSFHTTLENLAGAKLLSFSGIAHLILSGLFAFMIIFYVYLIVGILVKKKQLKSKLEKPI